MISTKTNKNKNKVFVEYERKMKQDIHISWTVGLFTSVQEILIFLNF